MACWAFSVNVGAGPCTADQAAMRASWLKGERHRVLCRSQTAALRSPCAQPLCAVDQQTCHGVKMKEVNVAVMPCAAGSMQMLPNGDVIPIPLAERIRAAAREKAKAAIAAAAAAAATLSPTAASDEGTGPSWKLGASVYEAAGAFAEAGSKGKEGEEVSGSAMGSASAAGRKWQKAFSITSSTTG